jgi:tetratricopeptide (TPR) repeat protein
MDDWLSEWVAALADGELERIDLDGFLRASEHFEVAAAERLRLLAIALEGRAIDLGARRGWVCVERVYARALRLAPDDAMIHESRGISASELARDGDEALVREAQRSIARAAELAPDDAMIAYQQGRVIYMHRRWSAAIALPYFERALLLDPECGWAALYRAHCLHDLERWPEAIAAYEAVPNHEFVGAHAWRMDVLVEQLGFCRLQAGDRKAALADFEAILTRYEAQPRLMVDNDLLYLHRVIDELPQLRERLLALERRADSLGHRS